MAGSKFCNCGSLIYNKFHRWILFKIRCHSETMCCSDTQQYMYQKNFCGSASKFSSMWMKCFEHYQKVSVYFCLHYMVFVELDACYISFQGDFYECETSLNILSDITTCIYEMRWSWMGCGISQHFSFQLKDLFYCLSDISRKSEC